MVKTTKFPWALFIFSKHGEISEVLKINFGGIQKTRPFVINKLYLRKNEHFNYLLETTSYVTAQVMHIFHELTKKKTAVNEYLSSNFFITCFTT